MELADWELDIVDRELGSGGFQVPLRR